MWPKFRSNGNGAILWPNLEHMQVAPSGGQICNWCKWCHVVAKFSPSHGVNFWVRCASGNVFSHSSKFLKLVHFSECLDFLDFLFDFQMKTWFQLSHLNNADWWFPTWVNGQMKQSILWQEKSAQTGKPGPIYGDSLQNLDWEENTKTTLYNIAKAPFVCGQNRMHTWYLSRIFLCG